MYPTDTFPTIFHHELEFMGYTYCVNFDADWVKISAQWIKKMSFMHGTAVNIHNINNCGRQYIVKYFQLIHNGITYLPIHFWERFFQPPMTHTITLLFLLFQSNLVTLLSYHTFIPLSLIRIPSVSHHPTLFQYQPYNWLEYLLAEANWNQNGDNISLNSNPISVTSYLCYIHLIASQYIYIVWENQVWKLRTEY